MSQTFSFGAPVPRASTPFRLDDGVSEVYGESSYLEPEVADRELEKFEALHESLAEVEATQAAGLDETIASQFEEEAWPGANEVGRWQSEADETEPRLEGESQDDPAYEDSSEAGGEPEGQVEFEPEHDGEWEYVDADERQPEPAPAYEDNRQTDEWVAEAEDVGILELIDQAASHEDADEAQASGAPWFRPEPSSDVGAADQEMLDDEDTFGAAVTVPMEARVEIEALAPDNDLPAVPVRSDLPIENDQFHVDPRYSSDEDNVVPPVWLLADRIRALLRQDKHDHRDRMDLKRAVERQLRTATPYDIVRQIARRATSTGRLTMYTLLFPGEARDNTGLKDLNDKVLGYILQQQFTERRQREIESIFHPQFVVAGQDFKIAIFISWEQNRAEFDRRLHLLDKKLRELLLKEFLPKSKKPGAKDLQRVLEKDPEYRFDIYYGTDVLAVEPNSQQVLTSVYLLLTQALKAAAVGRYISKGQSLKVRVARRFGENAKRDKKVDPRGKAFSQEEFLKVAAAAPAIKKFMLTDPIDHTPVSDYNTIYVDTVWTKAFYPRQSVGDRDVIRDVRKKNLKKPEWPNVKLTFAAQRELLELWLVTLNLVDFIKDFLDQEFGKALLDQHDLGVQVLDDLRDDKSPIDRRRAEKFLSQDVRAKRLAALGTASEYQFYATAADHPARIIFMMDVRDLGVEVLMMYDKSNAKILDERLAGERLLHECLRSTESVTEMRRFTHELVLTTFGRYHALLKQAATVNRTEGSADALKAFKVAAQPIGNFEDDVQVMLGGDEIIVAAHPKFATYVHRIVADLSQTVLGPGPGGQGARSVASPRLRVRAGVAFSLANPAGQRQARQLAHQQAMRLADESHSILKELERQHRRIERLLDKLDLVKDKRAKVPEYRRQLEVLRLLKLFTRVKHGHPTTISQKRFDALVQVWRRGSLPEICSTDIELVSHEGQVVDCKRLIAQASNLEAAVRKDVGKANVHIDPPPAVKIPMPKPDKDVVRTQ